MFERVKDNLWATKIFFVVRFAAALVVSLFYILLAAGVQDVYVGIFGETTFNYIIGGALSLALGAWLCTYAGGVVFLFVRGWHVAALSRSKDITERNLSALDAGMLVFRKHMSSFAAVYGSSLLISKFAVNGVEKVWDMLEEVPYLGSLAKVADFPLVRHLARDLLDTCYDAVIFYIVKYTKPGLADDVEAVPVALRKYLYALPSVIGGSLSAYLLLYVLPFVVKVFCIVGAFLSEGIVGGLLLTVLMYPLFYMLKHVVFDPVETIILISSFSGHVNDTEPEDGPFKSAVNTILEGIGFDDGTDGEEDDELADAPPKRRTPEPEPEPDEDLEPAQDGEGILNVMPTFDEPAGDVADLPLADGDPDSQPISSGRANLDRIAGIMNTFGAAAGVADAGDVDITADAPEPGGGLGTGGGSEPAGAPTPNLNFLLRGGSAPAPEEDEPEEFTPPVARLSSLLGGIDPSLLSQGLGDDSDTNSNPLGGDDIEFM